MKSKKVVVVMGGPSDEAEVSRRSGKAVADALRSKNLDVTELEFVPESFTDDIRRAGCDVVFNAVHGAYGEDGRIAAALDMMKIPYTSSGVLASALTMDKIAAKDIFKSRNIPTPRSTVIYKGQRRVVELLFGKVKPPCVVKAPSQGSSIGVVIVPDFMKVSAALDEVYKYGDAALVEEFIFGRELTVSVVGDLSDVDVLPIIEITTKSGRYDYESKYTKGASRHIVPAEISYEAFIRVRGIAIRTFLAFGCRGVARIDVMLDKEDKPYVIDVNTVPGMTETSLVPDAARAAGIGFGDFCVRLLEMASFS